MLVVNMRQDGTCEETQAGKGNKSCGERKVKLNKGQYLEQINELTKIHV